MHLATEKRAPPFAEFVALMAMMMSLVALSIDSMLSALSAIGADLAVANANDNQLVVALLFLGLACGQLIYGPLSDSVGRKPAVYLGFGIFFIGSVRSLLAGRYLQGLGLAGPRTLSLAIIRDQYSGRAMARVMSFIMSVFILVPMAAPGLARLYPCCRFRVQPVSRLFEFGPADAAGTVWPRRFVPTVFCCLALVIGTAIFLNDRLVMRYGMRFLCKCALLVLTALMFANLCRPSTAGLVDGISGVDVILRGILFGNLNAMAMEPLGHIAGMGAAVVGALSTFICVPFGILIGRGYDGIVLPLIIGFAVFGALTLGVMQWVERGE